MQTPNSSTIHPSYFKLIADGEPFRLLFPVGALLGMVGVMLWPAYVWQWGWLEGYPVHIHARMMVQGFLTCFVVGFLGTALPRLLDVSRITAAESFLYAGALIAVSFMQMRGLAIEADLLFWVTLSCIIFGLLVRLPQRKDTPPPGFVLVIMGIACAWGSSFAMLMIQIAPGLFPYSFTLFIKCLLYEGFLLLPIMGIGAFLLPRFFGLPSRQVFPESLSLPKGWLPRAAFAAFCGVSIIVSFVCEASGYPQIGYAMRAGAVFLYFFREVPVHKAKFGKGSLAWALRIALISIPLGYAALALYPTQRLTLIHIVFINGFSLLTFTVATRVVLGHSGQDHKFRLPLKSIIAMTALFILAMATRVSADWMPDIRLTHYAYAALAWVAAVAVWSVCILPSVRKADV